MSKLAVLVTIAVAVLGKTMAWDYPPCDDPWKHINGMCTKFYDDLFKSWDEALAICKSQGGNLVQIESDAEYQGYVPYMTVKYGYWIGVRRVGGEFKYVNGGSVSRYHPWDAFEPGYYDEHADCVVVSKWFGGTWMAQRCASKSIFMCEKQPRI